MAGGWECLGCEEWVDDSAQGVESFGLGLRIDQGSFLDQFVAHRLYSEVDELLQVLYFFQAELVVNLAVSVVLEDRVLRESLAMDTYTCLGTLVSMLLDVVCSSLLLRYDTHVALLRPHL